MVTVTPKAAEQIKELMIADDKDTDKNALRIFVQGGGCSEFQYGLMLNEEDSENDQKFESNGIKIVVDPISIRYLNDVEVDYVDGSGGFTIKNPNAKSTCGCGQSFEA